MFTVAQIRDDIAPFTLDSGKCRDSEFVLKYINAARQLLWARGNFVGLMATIRVKAYNGQVTLPYDYLKATDARVCGESVAIDNEWYEYADNVQFTESSCWQGMIDLGENFASFLDYDRENCRLMVKAEMIGDEGKEISFNAIGEFGNRVEIKGRLGKDHERVTFNPWIKYFRSASKEATEGRVRVYIFDPNRGVEKVCAIYEADDLAPTYRRYRVGRSGSGYFYLRCKRRYRDLLRETDKVEFGTDSLIQACIAITHRRNKKAAEFASALNLAVEQENQALKDDKLTTGGRIKLSRQRRVDPIISPHYASGPYFGR